MIFKLIRKFFCKHTILKDSSNIITQGLFKFRILKCEKCNRKFTYQSKSDFFRKFEENLLAAHRVSNILHKEIKK